VLVSSVLFDTAEIVPDLATLAASCRRHGARLLIDAYHHLNVVPFDVTALGIPDAFVTGGGYKYCQLGEGNCFLRVPPDHNLRPVLTGWFAEFAQKEQLDSHRVSYPAGAAAFMGATYDPVSHYRAAAVFDFHAEHDLHVNRLRDINRRQVTLLKSRVERLDLDPAMAAVVAMPEHRRGGFLAIRAARAQELSTALRARGLRCDARGTLLRMGPAPYLGDDQLIEAVAILADVAIA